jgi:hypothetical protein
MHRFKVLIVFLPCFLGLYTAIAQQGWFSLDASYGLGINGITHPYFEQSKIDGNDVTVTSRKIFLGAGYNYRGDIRYYFNDYAGIGLRTTLFYGDWNHFVSERKIVYVQTTSRHVKTSGFSVAAALHLRMGDESFSPFITVSPGFFSGKMIIMDTITYDDQVKSSQWEYTPLRKLFLSYAAGFDVSVTEEFKLFLEVSMQHFTVSPDRAELIIRDGSDYLENIPVNEKMIVFKDVITADYTQSPDETKAKQELRFWLPMDQCAIRLGFRIRLGQ